MARARLPFQYQEKPRCLGCSQPIEDMTLAVFAASCGHETCPSDIWHYNHFMEARDVCQRHADDPAEMAEALSQVIANMRER